MAGAGMAAGGLWIVLSGALRQYRGVNETISSLLLVYIGLAILNHLVEGPMRDPASLNKPSTREIGAANMIGTIPGTDVHWGLAFGVIAAVLAYVLIFHTTFGFAARVAGGNVRAAKVVGLAVGRLILVTCFLAGGAAGLAGMVEVAAVQGRANANLAVGYGFTGILVSFLARHNPLAVIPVADIEDRSPAPITLMPKDLLSRLNENEVLDLLAYVLSRGNAKDAVFKK